MQDERMYPKKCVGFAIREIDGETVILNRHSEKIHQLNVTASYIWNLCNGVTSIEDIIKAAAGHFGAPIADIEQDVRRCILQLQDLGLVEEVGE